MLLIVSLCPITIQFYIIVSGPWSTLHRETICAVLDVWSSSIHVNHSSDEQLDYIDVVLLNFVKYAKLV